MVKRKRKVHKLDTRKKPKEKLSKHSPYSWLTLDHPQLDVYVKHWYKKLKDEGFNDIEGGQRFSPYFSGKNKLQTSFHKSKQKELFYRVLTNYLTHNPVKDKKLRIIAEMYTDGVGSYNITKEIRRRGFASPNSVYWVHYRIKDFVKAAFDWNRTDGEGILTEEYEKRNDAKIIHIALGEDDG